MTTMNAEKIFMTPLQVVAMPPTVRRPKLEPGEFGMVLQRDPVTKHYRVCESAGSTIPVPSPDPLVGLDMGTLRQVLEFRRPLAGKIVSFDLIEFNGEWVKVHVRKGN